LNFNQRPKGEVLVRNYETTFILNPQADDATLDQQIKNVLELIANSGGNIIREERMGTRRLAYPIAGLTQGHYASIIFKAPATTLPILDRHYRLEEPIIRHLTIVFEGDPVALTESSRSATASFFEKEERARAERMAARAAADEERGYSRPPRRHYDRPSNQDQPARDDKRPGPSGSDEQL